MADAAMDPGRPIVDVIYVAASAHDARFTRICVASIRQFYPDVPVRILAGGKLENGLAEELERRWRVSVADLPQVDYGWGFVKLEPLFGPPGERFLVMDSDTVMTGPVLDCWRGEQAPFLVDDEPQTEADMLRLYYDWPRLQAHVPEARAPLFTFNSGQWFGTAGVLSRADFDPVLEWGRPPQLRHADCFMPGDQGVLNFVLNQKVHAGALEVALKPLMRWPGHGMDDLSVAAIAERTAPVRIIHWAGMKSPRLSAMKGADVLIHFEKLYYRRAPVGDLSRSWRGLRYRMFDRASPISRAARRIGLSWGG